MEATNRSHLRTAISYLLKVMKTRNGKIARLPKKIREELNQRMEEGCTGAKLAEWLNELPSVKKVLRELFKSQPISEQNLSQWRDGGYEDWLRHRETREQLRWAVERSEDVELDEGSEIMSERLARIVGAELAQHLQRLAHIDDPEERWRHLREISQELWRLRNATSYGDGVRLGWRRWEREVDQEESIAEAEARQHARESETQEEYLEHLMDLLHRSDLREWVRTDWPNREAEMRRLKEIYHLKPDSQGTPGHPSQQSRDAARRGAVYNYPANQSEIKA
jgi:hypothetical protein